MTRADSTARPVLPRPLDDAPVVASYKSARTSLEVLLPRKDLLVTRMTGHLDVGATDAICKIGERQMKAGIPIWVFHDWDGASGYDSDARQRFTAFSLAWKSQIRRVTVLTQSKLLAMGVATVNLATSLAGVPMASHTNRATFERELAEALGGK